MGGSERQAGRRTEGYYAEITEMTFGKFRIIWTDGRVIDDGW